MSEQQSDDGRHRGALRRQCSPAWSLLLVVASVAVALLLPLEEEYRTGTMRPDERVCDASYEHALFGLNELDAVLFGGEIAHLPPAAAEVRPILREAGVPEEMLYLMLVESGGNPDAARSARAVGMWQFMEPTAREMGLSVTPYFDTRRQPEASTRAVARYLDQLHGEFGSWWLAMAAYNAGPHRVRRALRRAPGADYFELSDRKPLLPSRREYVPKTLAALPEDQRLGMLRHTVRASPSSSRSG